MEQKFDKGSVRDGGGRGAGGEGDTGAQRGRDAWLWSLPKQGEELSQVWRQ